MSSDEAQIKILGDFITFGFVPDLNVAKNQAAWLEGILNGESAVKFDLRDHARTRDLLANVIRSELRRREAKAVRIGVSSGLDSRAMLGALSDFFDMSNVFAYTYGHPGNQDYEHAPNLVGNLLENYELRNYSKKNEYDLSISKGRKVNDVDVEIRGYLGIIAGGHLRDESAPESWGCACDDFINWQNPFTKFNKNGWVPSGYDPKNSLPTQPNLSKSVLDYDDQLNLLFRQHQRILKKPGCIDSRNLKLTNFNSVNEANLGILAPLYTPELISCCLNTPRTYRFEERAYKNFLFQSYPQFFPDLAPSHPYIITNGSTNVEITHIWRTDHDLRARYKKQFKELQKFGFNYIFDDFSDMIASGDKVAAKFAGGLVKAAPRLRKLKQTNA